MAIGELNNTLVNDQFSHEDCINFARLDRLKATGFMVLSGTAALGDKILMPLAVAIIAFEIAEIAAGILLLPLIIIYPLYSLTSSVVGICGGLAGFGLYMGYRESLVPNIKNYSDEFFKKAVSHWNSSTDWYARAERSVEI